MKPGVKTRIVVATATLIVFGLVLGAWRWRSSVERVAAQPVDAAAEPSRTGVTKGHSVSPIASKAGSGMPSRLAVDPRRREHESDDAFVRRTEVIAHFDRFKRDAALSAEHEELLLALIYAAQLEDRDQSWAVVSQAVDDPAGVIDHGRKPSEILSEIDAEMRKVLTPAQMDTYLYTFRVHLYGAILHEMVEEPSTPRPSR
jgi:hypothetical protein